MQDHLTIEETYQLTREVMEHVKKLDELYPGRHEVNLHISTMMKLNYAYTIGFKAGKRTNGQSNK